MEMAQTFDRPVEKRTVGHFQRFRKRVRIHHETVVLACDLDPPGGEVLDRMIGAAVAAIHLAGAGTRKMDRGHRGANHPVKDLATGRIEITSQNHGFVVDPDTLPETLEVTHRSLFDGSIEGLRHLHKPAFCVQYHPESSPGPHDSRYLFERFTALMDERKG